MIDLDAERIKIEEELEYTKGFLKIVQQKLTNYDWYILPIWEIQIKFSKKNY